MGARTIEFDEEGRPPVLQPWLEEEIRDYQAIVNWKLEPYCIHAMKNMFSRQKWSRAEIEEYQEKKKELAPFYYAMGLPRSNPEARMEYITNVLGIIGYNFKTDNTNYLAVEEGKAKALVLLEDVFLIEKENYSRAEIKRTTKKILNLVEKTFLIGKGDWDRLSYCKQLNMNY
ncbi:MAG: hypothetical protein ABIF18_03510 [archaeon]